MIPFVIVLVVAIIAIDWVFFLASAVVIAVAKAWGMFRYLLTSLGAR